MGSQSDSESEPSGGANSKKDENISGRDENEEVSKKSGTSKAEKQPPSGKLDCSNVKAVIFVPHTEGSVLAKALRELEELMFKITGYRIKIQERAGTPLERILHKSNPWSGQDCMRESCLLCTTKAVTGKNKTQDCHRRNATYETWCQTCKIRDEEQMGIGKAEDDIKVGGGKGEKGRTEVALFKYVGETNRSCFERGSEHCAARRGFHKNSHMLKHIVDKHGEEDMRKIRFGMKAVKFHRAAFERQIFEAVLIQNNRSHHLLNSKAEFNRCAIPRLGLKMGENEYKEKRKEMREDDERDKELEESILKLRKNLNKHRHEAYPDKNQPKRKKRRICDLGGGNTMTEENISEEERWLEEKLEAEIEKRQEEIDKAKSIQRKRKKNEGEDIRGYFSVTTNKKLKTSEDSTDKLPSPVQILSEAPQPSSAVRGREGSGDSSMSLAPKSPIPPPAQDNTPCSPLQMRNSQDKSPPPKPSAVRGRERLGDSDLSLASKSPMSPVLEDKFPPPISGRNSSDKSPPPNNKADAATKSVYCKVEIKDCVEDQNYHKDFRENNLQLEDNIGLNLQINDDLQSNKKKSTGKKTMDGTDKSPQSEDNPPRYPVEYEELFYNWEEIQRERKDQNDRIEEIRDRRLQISAAKEMSWKLLRICIDFLKEHGQDWQEGSWRNMERRRNDLEKNERKIDRFRKISEKKSEIKTKLLQTKIGEKTKLLRGKENSEWEQYIHFDPTEREMRAEAAEAKENLWRWRGGED